MESTFLLNNFNYEITLVRSANIATGSNLQSISVSKGKDVIGDGGFQECSGLQIEMDVQQLQEGGRNDGVIQRVGRAKYQNLVLKRGMLYNKNNQLASDHWQWIQDVLSGVRPVARYDGLIKVFGHKKNGAAEVVASWEFERALPAKITGPQLNAKSGDVAIEELHLAHEGLRMVVDG